MTDPDPSARLPADAFMHLIVSFLTPMFIATTGGNIEHARSAAIGTVNAYTLSGHDDLLSVAQIIALGLATLDSLNRSMKDDLSLTMVLRLRGNAASLSRAADRCHRARHTPATATPPTLQPQAPQPQAPQPQAPDPEIERQKDAAVLAEIAAVRQHLATINATGRPVATENTASRIPRLNPRFKPPNIEAALSTDSKRATPAQP